jgi:hypothetical protein
MIVAKSALFFPPLASLVFGEGQFDHTALYVTCTRPGGGKIWKIPVGVKAGRIYR